jgi:hypothetical protein
VSAEIFVPLAHEWDIKSAYRPGLRHPTRIEKTCTVCKITGRKSSMEGCAPCPGAEHSAECLKSYGWKRVNDFFECQCGSNKDHQKKKFWKIDACVHCDRPRAETHLTRCSKSGNGWHTFRLRKIGEDHEIRKTGNS